MFRASGDHNNDRNASNNINNNNCGRVVSTHERQQHNQQLTKRDHPLTNIAHTLTKT